MKCPACEGKGGWHEDFGEGTVLFEGCSYCKESGKISLLNWLWYQAYQVESVADVLNALFNRFGGKDI